MIRWLRRAALLTLGVLLGAALGVAVKITATTEIPAVVAVNAGGAAYKSGGISFVKDSGFAGGWIDHTTNTIAGTGDQALFQTQHYRMTDWSAAEPNGTYRVTLDFAETYWTTVGARVFSVSSHGVPLVTNLDLFATVGRDRAYTVTKDIKVSTGRLDLHFTATASVADVQAIVVNSLSTAQPPSGVALAPGDDIQAAVNANPPGTTFLLQSGIYRMQAIFPKSGDTFTGQTGTVLSGARVLGGWTRSGATWSVGGQTQNQPFYGQCDPAHPLCSQPEDLFVDGVLLPPVGSLSAVTAGTWFFDHSASTITVGADPTGHLVETSVTPKAFDGIANSVTVQNMTIEMYATELQNGTVQAGPTPGGWPDGGDNWILQDLTVQLNHGVGVAMGNGTVLNRVHANKNGNLGISGTSASGGVVNNSEIAGNNTVGVDLGWSAGGAKWAGDYNNLLVENTSVHDNIGAGLWVDESDYNSTFTNNTVTNNSSVGIFIEISYKALVNNNTVTGNGLADPPSWLWNSGIQVAASSDVEVTGNIVNGNGNAIAGMQQNRGSGTMGPHLLVNLNVHNNTISLNPGEAGVVDDTQDPLVFSGRGNRFANNTWTNVTGGYPFAWGNQWFTLAGWAATGNS